MHRLIALPGRFGRVVRICALIGLLGLSVGLAQKGMRAALSSKPVATELVSTPAGSPVHAPEPLAIYYGWPSAVASEDGAPASPTDLFAQFAVVVLGAGLAEPAHPDHANAVALLNALRSPSGSSHSVETYGYIDMGITTQSQPLSVPELAAQIAGWRRMGVTGIFWDDVGYEFAGGLDYAAYRQRQVELLERTHAAGLNVFVNVWDPDDVFLAQGAARQSLPTVRLRPGDILLAESWFVSADRYVDPMRWYRKAEQLAAYRRQQPFRLACVSTGADHPGTEESDAFKAAYWASVMYECDLFQHTDPHYGAAAKPGGGRLYVHRLIEPASGDRFTGSVQVGRVGALFEFRRPTEAGEIVVASDGQGTGYGLFRRREGAP